MPATAIGAPHKWEPSGPSGLFGRVVKKLERLENSVAYDFAQAAFSNRLLRPRNSAYNLAVVKL
jgi:hypothetical protein